MITSSTKQQSGEPVTATNQESVTQQPRELVRRSFSKSFGRFVRSAEEQPNLGVTELVNDLLEPEKIMKGLFGFNDLSSFGQPAPSGSFSIDIQHAGLGIKQVVQPVFSFKQLSHLYLTSTTLRECIQAYVRNIESYGHRIEYIGPEGKRESRVAKAEKARIDSLLASLVQNGETVTEARENSRIDKEVIGARAFEVMEDTAGRVVGIKRIPTNTLLMTRLDKEQTPALLWNSVTHSFQMQMRRFRQFMQRDDDGKAVYFKEIGDPRPIDPSTGEVNENLSIEEEATSIWYDRYYTPGSSYGTPQWAACIPSMLGSREAENVNLSFFRDNAIPAMAVLVSGGALTEESFNKIESYFTQVRGKDAQNRIVVLEASSDVSEVAGIDGSISAPKIDIKPMLSDRQHEGLFSKYIEAGSEKIRQSLRLPPIYIGHAAEYNRASAFASMQTAEQQVFIPERLSWDMFMNDVVLAGHGFTYWKVSSVQPAYNDPQETAQMLTVLGREGALTPNICIQLSNRYLNTDIESVHKDWGDMPFAVTLAALASGSKIDGFEYTMEKLATAATGTDTTDPATIDTTVNEPTDSEAIVTKNAIAALLEDVAELGSRAAQTFEHVS